MTNRIVLTLVMAVGVVLGGCVSSDPPDSESASLSIGEEMKTDTAIFAAGCFWGVEAAFRRVEGVTSTKVGYTGGHTEEPSYREVCSDATGHAEAVLVEYDPETVSYRQLLEVFWRIHDPTTPNRQGPDAGSQYRSAIFYTTDEQREAALASKRTLDESGRLRHPVVTEVVPASRFWLAEDYHQRYYEKHGGGSCRTN